MLGFEKATRFTVATPGMEEVNFLKKKRKDGKREGQEFYIVKGGRD